MSSRFALVIFCVLLLLSSFEREVQAKKHVDPYKVLGVDKNASQRDIQKAFHKLSLQYHPDKNKKKDSQEKFSEINNAYEILSDEEKKKNYDIYGDENGARGFNGRNFGGENFGGHEGYTYFPNSGPSGGHTNFRREGWQGNTFSFSYGGDHDGGSDSFGFSFGDMFANLFRGQGQNSFGSFGGSGRPKSGSTSANIRAVNSQIYRKEIVDQGLTWLLLFYTPSSKGYHTMESIVEEVSNSFQGAMKAGSINCQIEQGLCESLGVWPSKSARLFFYCYRTSESGALVEYTSDLDSRSLKSFCQDQMPKFSKRVTLNSFDFLSNIKGDLPQVLLLSTKKETPVIWRALSGMYRKQFVFLDAEAHDVTDKNLKRLGVHALPAVVGRLINGEVHVLKEGITVKDLETGISEMKALLDSIEKKNKMTSNSESKQYRTDSKYEGIPHLTSSNMDSICSDKTTLCIIGVFRSSNAKDKLKAILSLVSQKTLIRRTTAQSSEYPIQYALLDANKQSAFLKSFDKSGFKSSEKILLAYKPRKGKFAAFTNEMTLEEVERFISNILNGDIRFSKVHKRPAVK